jgi:hypothetical protein
MTFIEFAEDVDGTDVLGGKTTKTETAETLLEAVLADGGWHEAAGVKQVMEAAGYPARTIQRAAKHLRVEYERRGLPSSTWWRISLAGATAPPVAPALVAPSAGTKVGATVETAQPGLSDPANVSVAPSSAGGANGAAGEGMVVELGDVRDEAVVLRLIPENATTEAALLAQVEQLVAERVGTIVERPA